MSRCFQYCVLVALFAFSNAEDFDPAPTSLSIGFVLFIISVAVLCYYCCRRRKVPVVTFERFSNEVDCPQNQRQPPRQKRFFRRGWNRNQTVNVVVHPIIPPTEVPERIQVSASAPAQPMVPPPYDQVHNPYPGHIYRLPQMDADHASPLTRIYR